jgi:signal transduction histidine kinase
VLTRDILSDARFRASLDWVDNVDTAVKVILQDAHDAYLIDYYLGAETGVDLLRTVRERGCRAPIIILTGRDDDGLDIDALEAGATDYLDKNSVNPILLERTIRYAVRQQHNQNRLEDLVKQVTRLEQLKTDMIRIAAHDLRTPLTVMSGYIDMLRDELDSQLAEHQHGYLDELKTAIARMRRIVGDILSLERIAETSGGYTDPINFSRLLAEIYETYATRAEQDFTLDMPPDPVTVYGAEAELREAIENLFSNAVKYTPPEGSITVSLSADSDVALFTIKDTGYGIPEQMQDKLFQPFYRAKTRETRKIEGTGLGLHLVKNIVERHNGQIYFESSYEKGSTFGFMLPQVEDGAL